jgi:hypothetical protein
MKTINQSIFALLLGFFLLGGSQNAQAQYFGTGTVNVSAGTSVLHIGAMNMPLVVTAEYGVMEYLGVGAYLGYGLGIKKDNWPYFDGEQWALSNLHVNNYMLGVQASFHFQGLLGGLSISKLAKKMDVFATGYGGARIVTRTVAKDRTAFDFPVKRKGILGLSLTGRYYFKEKWAAFLELGRSPSGYVAFGVTTQVR